MGTTKKDAKPTGVEVKNGCCAENTITSYPPSNESSIQTWFTDEKDPGVSYASSYLFPPKDDSEWKPKDPPEINSFQVCSAARIVTSEISRLPAIAVEGDPPKNQALKMDTKYLVETGIVRTKGNKKWIKAKKDIEMTISESGALANFVAAATAILALYAF